MSWATKKLNFRNHNDQELVALSNSAMQHTEMAGARELEDESDNFYDVPIVTCVHSVEIACARDKLTFYGRVRQ